MLVLYRSFVYMKPGLVASNEAGMWYSSLPSSCKGDLLARALLLPHRALGKADPSSAVVIQASSSRPAPSTSLESDEADRDQEHGQTEVSCTGAQIGRWRCRQSNVLVRSCSLGCWLALR